VVCVGAFVTADQKYNTSDTCYPDPSADSDAKSNLTLTFCITVNPSLTSVLAAKQSQPDFRPTHLSDARIDLTLLHGVQGMSQ